MLNIGTKFHESRTSTFRVIDFRRHVNELSNEVTNQQTRQIAISPGGSDNNIAPTY